MLPKATSDKQIIRDLGGPSAVAAALKHSVDAVKQWSSRGLIPWSFRSKVKKLAAQKRKPLPSDFMEERRAA